MMEYSRELMMAGSMEAISALMWALSSVALMVCRSDLMWDGHLAAMKAV